MNSQSSFFGFDEVPMVGLGLCAKVECSKKATLKSSSGKSAYCLKHGQCSRGKCNADHDHCKKAKCEELHDHCVKQGRCKMTVEDFLYHPRLKTYVCPCVLRFDIFYKEREKAMKKWSKKNE